MKLIAHATDTWKTEDGRFTVVLEEPETDTFVYIVYDTEMKCGPHECVALNSARAYIKRDV